MTPRGSLHASSDTLNTARMRFADGEPLPQGLLPEPVARSWVRSLESGLLPWHAARYETVDMKSASASRDARRLRACVIDEIEHLWDAFGGPDWTILCTNRDGIIEFVRQSSTCKDNTLRSIMSGRCMYEANIGTTAPICAMHDGVDVVVDRGQHYLAELRHLFCLAVPLFGLSGEIVGTLDITGTGNRHVGHMSDAFRLAALAVEQRFFATLRGCHLLRVHHDPRWLDTPLAGVLAIEESAEVRATSRSARHILSLPQQAPLPTLSLQDVMTHANPVQLRRVLSPRAGIQRVPWSDGSHVYIKYARAPSDRSTARRLTSESVDAPVRAQGAGAAAAVDASLHEHTLHAARDAWREHGGNVSAAARQLGISRTTLYAKLRVLRQMGLVDET